MSQQRGSSLFGRANTVTSIMLWTEAQEKRDICTQACWRGISTNVMAQCMQPGVRDEETVHTFGYMKSKGLSVDL